MNRKGIKSAVDVLVVGLGPAGLSAALSLRQQGLSVAIVGRLSGGGFKAGESLSVQASRVLRQLGFAIEHTGHLPCYGNRSSWGSPKLAFTDFIHQPGGKGWHLDRLLFEEQLLVQVEYQKVQVYAGALLQQVHRKGSVWQCTLRDKQLIEAKFLVDATGRNAWLSRRLGINKTLEDRQLAMVAWMQSDQHTEDSFSLIETSPTGWWYSAALPGGKLVVMMILDPQMRAFEATKMLQEQLGKSYYTKDRIQKGSYRYATTPAWLDASSGYLPQMYGEGWVAVGDAALCYDPIAAHGLTMALVSGRDVGPAVASALSNDYRKLKAYQAQLKQAFAAYAYQRGQIYRQEQRWPESVYWENRVQASAAFLRKNGMWGRD